MCQLILPHPLQISWNLLYVIILAEKAENSSLSAIRRYDVWFASYATPLICNFDAFGDTQNVHISVTLGPNRLINWCLWEANSSGNLNLSLFLLSKNEVEWICTLTLNLTWNFPFCVWLNWHRMTQLVFLIYEGLMTNYSVILFWKTMIKPSKIINVFLVQTFEKLVREAQVFTN